MILDSTEDAINKQREVVRSKSPVERAAMGMEMIDNTHSLVCNSIREKFPDISHGELISKVFYRYYRNDFSEVELEKIMSGIVEYHKNNP